MSDFISRQDTIEELEHIMCDHPLRGYEDEQLLINAVKSLPSAEPKTDEENELKFYYVESIDDYWIGKRLDNFYYADWHDGLGFVWSKSRYLPWGEHIVDENTLWKEHTYPSEPIEVPFTEWIVGFVKKYSAEPKTGKWKHLKGDEWLCSNCGYVVHTEGSWEHPLKRGKDYCEHCGAKMLGEDGE